MCDLVAECLRSKPEVLSSNPSTVGGGEEKEERKGGRGRENE
jgi:hypothetical protein